MELALRLIGDGFRFFTCDSWMWNWLDALIVSTSVLEFLVNYVILDLLVGVGAINNASNMRILRMIRIMRLVRVFRVTRMMRFIRALRTLVYSIFSTLKSLVWAMLLLLMITYVFGIIFTQAVSEYFLDNDWDGTSCPDGLDTVDGALMCYWGSLSTSMFTLFKSMCGGLSWDTVVSPLGHVGVFWVGLFVVFISFAYFAVLNVVTGVFCQSAMESAEKDAEMLKQHLMTNKKHYVDQITELFKNLTGSDTSNITFDTFEHHMQDDAMKAYFASIELDIDDAWTLFKLLDEDNTRAINVEEFVIGCLRLKGPAKSIHIAQLLSEHKWVAHQLTTFMNNVEDQFRIVRSEAEAQSALLVDLLDDGGGDGDGSPLTPGRRRAQTNTPVFVADGDSSPQESVPRRGRAQTNPAGGMDCDCAL